MGRILTRVRQLAEMEHVEKTPSVRIFLETHRLKSYNNLAKKLPTLLEGDVDDDEEIA